jgi:hypothetical protein
MVASYRLLWRVCSTLLPRRCVGTPKSVPWFCRDPRCCHPALALPQPADAEAVFKRLSEEVHKGQPITALTEEVKDGILKNIRCPFHRTKT